MIEYRLAVALLSALRQCESVSFEILEEKFERLDKKCPGLIPDFGLEMIERVCSLHPYELQIYTEVGKPAGIKRGEIWSGDISRIEMERYCRTMDEKHVKLLTCLMYL